MRLNVIVALLLVACALSLVSSQYEARRLHIDLEAAQDDERKLGVEWAQLQLDQASLSKHSLIDSAARRDLGMVPASPARTQYLSAAKAALPSPAPAGTAGAGAAR